jgi:hypothetical protein
VTKHPLFFLEKTIKGYSEGLHRIIFGDESLLIAFNDPDELVDEDDDVK